MIDQLLMRKTDQWGEYKGQLKRALQLADLHWLPHYDIISSLSVSWLESTLHWKQVYAVRIWCTESLNFIEINKNSHWECVHAHYIKSVLLLRDDTHIEK